MNAEDVGFLFSRKLDPQTLASLHLHGRRFRLGVGLGVPESELAPAGRINEPGCEIRRLLIAEPGIAPRDFQWHHRAFANKNGEFVQREIARYFAGAG